MKNGFSIAFSVVATLILTFSAEAEEAQWIRATVLLETGYGKIPRVEETLVPGGIYSMEEVARRGQAAIDEEILERIRTLGEGMREAEQKMRLGTLLARQYYLKLETGRKAVLPAIDLNPRLGIVIEPVDIGDRAICKIQFLEPEGPLGTTEFTGELITLRLKDADLKDVLRTFSVLTETSIEIDPSIRRSVSVDLREVPWDQALDLILRINGLGWERQGSTLKVAPLEEMSARKKVRTEATVNLPRGSGGSSTIASQGDDTNPTVVLMVESVDGPPELVAERDGLVQPKRVVLVSADDEETANSIDEVAVFRGVVTGDGNLQDAEVLASPSSEYAERLLDALKGWEFRYILDEEGRRQEAVVGYGIRFRPPQVLALIAVVDHIGVEISAKPQSGDRRVYVVEAVVTDLDTGSVISQPRVTTPSGQEATVRTGFRSPSGESADFVLKITISGDPASLDYSWTLTSEGKVVSSHQAKIEL